MVVGWVGEDEVEGLVAIKIGDPSIKNFAIFDILAQDFCGSRMRLDESRRTGAARESLEAERTGAGKSVQHIGTIEIRSEHIKQSVFFTRAERMSRGGNLQFLAFILPC